MKYQGGNNVTVNVTCQSCGKKFIAIRKSRKTCSPACRQRLHRGTGPAPIDQTVFGDLDIDFKDIPSREKIESILDEMDPKHVVDKLKLDLEIVEANRRKILEKLNPLLKQCDDLKELLENKLNEARIEMSKVATLPDSEKKAMDHYQHIHSARDMARRMDESRPKIGDAIRSKNDNVTDTCSSNVPKINDNVTDTVTNTVTGKSRISGEMLSRLKNKKPLNADA
jgi:hypothetical protein